MVVRSEIKCFIVCFFVFFFILGKGLICCGDDKGSLWLYNLPQFGRDSPNPVLKTKIDVSTLLMWPELQDDHLENSRKVPLDRHDIIIDKVAASHDNNYVVAVTSNNMVRIFFLLKSDNLQYI